MSEIKDRISGLIQKITEEEEIPIRRREFSLDTVNTVLRYGAIIGPTLEHHKQIPRGMDWARQLIHTAEEANQSFHSGTVILADTMLQSRGRFKRLWHAPQGGLWMTLVLVNTLLPESNLLVPMAAGVASCETLLHYGITARIKWVNDVLAEGRKISGILTETFTGSRFGEEYVLVGIVIIVNNDEFPAEFSELATSLKSSLGKEISLTEMAARLLVKLRWNIGLLYYEEARHLENHGGIGNLNGTRAENRHEDEHLLLKSYKALTDVFGRRVLFGFDVRKNPLFEAKVAGLDSSGGLILELDDGSRIVQHSGEIIYLD
jgi:BirA family biotin operon repressor/biotin-[acetyl-CoA-carboxylase] ligase